MDAKNMSKKKKYDPLKITKDIIRKKFFEDGGTPNQWLPYSKIFKSKRYKKPKHKNAEEEE